MAGASPRTSAAGRAARGGWARALLGGSAQEEVEAWWSPPRQSSWRHERVCMCLCFVLLCYEASSLEGWGSSVLLDCKLFAQEWGE